MSDAKKEDAIAKTRQWLRSDLFRPQVAVVSSFDVEALCQKNGLTFCDMLLPFAQLTTEGAYKDPASQSVSISVRNLHLDFRDLRKDGFLLANDGVLSNVLSEAVRSIAVDLDCSSAPSTSTDVPKCEWYDVYKTALLHWIEPSEHELLRHYLACVLVVSSNHHQPLEQLAKLSQSQHVLQHQGTSPAVALGAGLHTAAPRWLLPNIFKYHVLVHDVSTADESKAEATYQSMKMTYGAHACHLLRLNSANGDADLPDPWHAPIISKYRGLAAGIKQAKQQGFGVKPTTEINGVIPSTAVSTSSVQNEIENNAAALAERASTPTVTLVADEKNNDASSPDLSVLVVRGESIPHALSTNDLVAAVTPTLESTALGDDDHWKDAALLGSIRGESDSFVYGRSLTTSDRHRIRVFVEEFVQRGLLPFVERQMRILNDQIVQRKGLSKSILTGAKKWFGGGGVVNAPSTASLGGTTAVTVSSAVVYTAECGEMQMRRLADLAFLFQHFQLAYYLYQSVKRDFQNDQSWLHHAGTLEMAAICAFILGPQQTKPYPQHYVDAAINFYMTTCNKPWMAIRCAIISTEILTAMTLNTEAAAHFIRLTSWDDDLGSALLLEQAANRFSLVGRRGKGALHAVLAGHRYAKANFRRHSLRCYRRAATVYSQLTWRYAQDHINYTMGHHSRALDLKAAAVKHFGDLLIDHEDAVTQQQAGFLKDYLTVLAEVSAGGCPSLSVPPVDCQRIRVFLGDCADNYESNNDDEDGHWAKLEKAIATASLPSSSMGRAAIETVVQMMDSRSDNSRQAITPVDERYVVVVPLRNTLDARIALYDVHLEWAFDDNVPSNDVVETEHIPLVVMEPRESKWLRLSLLPRVGSSGRALHVTALRYGLTAYSADGTPQCPAVYGRQELPVRGRRLNSTQAEQMTVEYGSDWRLHPLISAPGVPCLKMELEPAAPVDSLECLCGEVVRFGLTVKNSSANRSGVVTLAADPSNCVSVTRSSAVNPMVAMVDGQRYLVWTLTDAGLAANEQSSFALWLRAPVDERHVTIKVLVSYSGVDSCLRTCRRQMNLHSRSSLTFRDVRSFNGLSPRSLLLCAEMENVHRSAEDQTIELDVLQYDCVNCHPSTPFIHAQASSLNTAVQPQRWMVDQLASETKAVHLKSGESERVCIRLRHDESGSLNRMDTSTSDRSLLGPGVHKDAPFPWAADRHLLSGCFVAVTWRTRIFPTYVAADVNGTKQQPFVRTAVGQHWIPLPPVDVASSTAEVPRAQNSVSASCRLILQKSHVEHDFLAQRLCYVPFGVRYSNASGQLATLRANATEIMYNGCTSQRLNGVNDVSLMAVIVSPGIYDVASGLKVTTDGGDNLPLGQQFVTIVQKQNEIELFDLAS